MTKQHRQSKLHNTTADIPTNIHTDQSTCVWVVHVITVVKKCNCNTSNRLKLSIKSPSSISRAVPESNSGRNLAISPSPANIRLWLNSCWILSLAGFETSAQVMQIQGLICTKVSSVSQCLRLVYTHRSVNGIVRSHKISLNSNIETRLTISVRASDCLYWGSTTVAEIE